LLARTNRLQDSAKLQWKLELVEKTIQQVLPSVTGFAVKQAIVALRKHNIATAPLLRRAGLSGHDIATSGSNASHRGVSAETQARFLDYAAEAMDDSAFGLHVAEQTDPRDAGMLFYVASGGKDVGEALGLLARYFRIMNEAVRLTLTSTREGLAAEVEFVGLPTHSVRQNAEFGVATIVKALREMTGRSICPTRTAFVHARNSDLREFERFYGRSVEFGRIASEGVASDLIEFSSDALAIPLITADPKLLDALRPFCDMAAKKRRTTPGTLRAAVENEVEKLLPHGKANPETVAKALALSVRTLARKLAADGTTYSEVVDELRRTLALQYLREQGLSLSEIAWLLGYDGQSSFNHAFKRWTGRSPSAARSKKRIRTPA
jgi:AraC-like DNA-binding protein